MLIRQAFSGTNPQKVPIWNDLLGDLGAVLKLFKFSDGCIIIIDSPDVHHQEMSSICDVKIHCIFTKVM